jgi:hypothetical protein
MSARSAVLNAFIEAVGAAALTHLDWNEVVQSLVRWCESRAAADPGFKALWLRARAEEDAELSRQGGWRVVFGPSPAGGVAHYWCCPPPPRAVVCPGGVLTSFRFN